jgi:hypothetical protein
LSVFLGSNTSSFSFFLFFFFEISLTLNYLQQTKEKMRRYSLLGKASSYCSTVGMDVGFFFYSAHSLDFCTNCEHANIIFHVVHVIVTPPAG